MVDPLEDDAALAKYFHVQRYRENRSGKIALSVYTALALIIYVANFRNFDLKSTVISSRGVFGLLSVFPPVFMLYYFAFIVSDPMELRDGMCFIGKILTNLLMLVSALYLGWNCYRLGHYLEMAVNLFSLPIQVSIFVPEHWPGATLMRPFVLRPEAEVEAERQDQITKWKSSVPRV